MIHTRAMLISMLCLALPLFGQAEETRLAMSSVFVVPVSEADLEEITTVMITRVPELASSPGIKSATAYRSAGTVSATVEFHPHARRGGMSRAIVAHCGQAEHEGPWTCESGSLRNYLQLHGQEFEVRVTGDVEYDVAMALIEATRGAVGAYPYRDSEIDMPDTVVMIFPGKKDTMAIGWGSKTGTLELSFRVALIDGRDQSDPRGWRVISVNNEPWLYPEDAS